MSPVTSLELISMDEKEKISMLIGGDDGQCILKSLYFSRYGIKTTGVDIHQISKSPIWSLKADLFQVFSK